MSTIIIQLADSGMPEAGKAAPISSKMSVEEKVRDMIECIESGEDSAVEWITLNKLYSTLENRKDERSKNLLSMIKPVMAKYGQHGVARK